MCLLMRRFGKMKILIGTTAVIALCAAPAVPAQAAYPPGRGCGTLSFRGYADPPVVRVQVLSGGVGCATARMVIFDGFFHRFPSHFGPISLPIGWHCLVGGYPQLMTCTRSSGGTTTARVGLFV